ncbi:Sarcosine oxidase protein [Penicillium angulare]|uniref:Sarcosine oxidase protein n=1 Tax=Penicillium angulare TaxID=116970 RepID=A0A9W9KD04_9EURO|nr:Sarcosine oxidase protein [Penicillium angulare]
MAEPRAAFTTKAAPVLIVGAGIFGLSTAIHAARRGYTNITVYDHQNYEKNQYEFEEGCDAASADINKIVRTAYGDQVEYQEMCTEAINEWLKWNTELASGNDLPPHMSSKDRVFINNGCTSLNGTTSMHNYDIDSIASMRAAGLKNSALITSDKQDQSEAKRQGLAFAIDPFNRQKRGLPYTSLLDTTAGYAIAHKACWLALHKAKRLGVHFVLGGHKGTLKELCYKDKAQTEISGITTMDGKFHAGSLVLVACGGWTPSLVTELDGLCETTAGSVAFVKIPRGSTLFERFSPENFPTFMYKMGGGKNGGLYGFARDDRGQMKIGYRGTKYTNPTMQADGKVRSVPVTRWTRPFHTSQIPGHALNIINQFIDEELPEIRAEGLGVTSTRLCWYTDTFDDHYLIDYVPGKKNLMVATGGSGHAFKFLPVIGRHVVDIWEGKETNTLPKKNWLWRKQVMGETPYNVIMQGHDGPNVLSNSNLVSAGVQNMAKL